MGKLGATIGGSNPLTIGKDDSVTLGVAIADSNPLTVGIGIEDAFSPRQLTGLTLWLDADEGVTVATGVSLWEDQSTTGNDMVQGTPALQPSLVPNDINSLPVIQGDGADDWMDFTSLLQIGDLSIFAVLRGTGYWMGSDLSGARYIYHNSVSDTFRTSAGISSFASAADAVGGNLIEYHRTGANLNCYKNGVASANNPRSNNANTDLRALMRRLGTYSTIRIAEVIVCTPQLSAEEISNTQDYLATKYAISI